MNKNINILLESLQDLDAFSDELERLEGEEYEKGLWDSTRPYSDVYNGKLDFRICKYFPKTKEELQLIIEYKFMEHKLLNHKNVNKVVDLNDIDVSKIEDMTRLFSPLAFSYKFSRKIEFNFDVSYWDVSNVKYMSELFENCINFNCNLKKWDVSNVSIMNNMFKDCESFEGDGLEEWDVSNVEYMANMFNNCKSFNGNLKDWDVSKVKEMGRMFYNCKSFNCDLHRWKTYNVDDMTEMFYGCESFDHDLSDWDISKCLFLKDNIFDGSPSFLIKNNKIKFYDLK